jgi:hypothetical protein
VAALPGGILGRALFIPSAQLNDTAGAPHCYLIENPLFYRIFFPIQLFITKIQKNEQEEQYP